MKDIIALRVQRWRHASICQLCQFSTAHTRRWPLPQRFDGVNCRQNPQLRWKRALNNISSYPLKRRFASGVLKNAQPTSQNAALPDVVEDLRSIRQSNSVPSDESIVQLLRKCLQIAESFVQHEHGQQEKQRQEDGTNAITSLLDLYEKNASRQPSKVTQSVEQQTSESVSQIANELLQDEKVFISPKALACYTKIQTLLRKPHHFPAIFSLYANKPIPDPNSSPVKFHQQNPRSIKNAVPPELANMALDVAIEQKNLALALAIIDSTFCAPAFHRAKVFKKAALPLCGLAAAPIASYTVASWVATLQNTMDISMATGIAFSAILAYVAFTSSVGIVAITTSNDQMVRVVWLPGMPLRHRWLREEERSALDKVAMAWGFKDPLMRGEEEGEEWETLRELIGMRGMILDKTDLMEGMQ
ncbi:hypothetical protein V8E54_012228 [Elaphomyces granulatus]